MKNEVFMKDDDRLILSEDDEKTDPKTGKTIEGETVSNKNESD